MYFWMTGNDMMISVTGVSVEANLHGKFIHSNYCIGTIIK